MKPDRWKAINDADIGGPVYWMLVYGEERKFFIRKLGDPPPQETDTPDDVPELEKRYMIQWDESDIARGVDRKPLDTPK